MSTRFKVFLGVGLGVTREISSLTLCDAVSVWGIYTVLCSSFVTQCEMLKIDCDGNLYVQSKYGRISQCFKI